MKLCSLAMIALVQTSAQVETMKRAIASVAAVVDEVVVVLDDRSLDGDDLNLVGVLVMRRRFESFSDQRNFAASMCTGEWVLVLDADDYFADVGNLRACFEKAPAAADRIDCRETTINEAGAVVEQGTQVVAYRRRVCSWKYRGHNKLLGGSPHRVRSTARMVYRHPYGEHGVAKAQRTIPLLMQDLAEDPMDPHAPYFLSRAHWMLGDTASVGKWAQIAIDFDPTSVEYAQAWALLALAKLDIEGIDACDAVAERGLKVHPNHIDLLDLRSFAFMARKMEACKDEKNPHLQSATTTRHMPRFIEIAESIGWPIRKGEAA